MKADTREQVLIRVITLMDCVRLPGRQEIILNLLHSARRASREGDFFAAQQHITVAIGQLRKARHSLRVAGAYEHEVNPVGYAITLLLNVQMESGADWLAQLNALVCSRECWYPLLILFIAIVLVIAFFRLTG